MRRETRVNLIFLAVFLVISLPGAVILVHKKLQPGAPRMDQPDVMVTRLPYMTPLPAPPGVKWIVPDQTQAWLQQVTKQRTGSAQVLSSAPPGPQWEPVISEDHLLQVIAATAMGDQTRVALVVWKGDLESSPSHYHVTIDSSPAQVLEVSEIDLPPEVRRELVRLDYVRPPQRVMWLEISLPRKLVSGTKASLTMQYDGSAGPLRSTVAFEVK